MSSFPNGESPSNFCFLWVWFLFVHGLAVGAKLRVFEELCGIINNLMSSDDPLPDLENRPLYGIPSCVGMTDGIFRHNSL